MLYLCITADHELFSGKNLVDEYDVVIKPTEMLMELLEQNGIPLTLFSDVCSIWKYRDCGWSEFPNQMEEQMKNAILKGHDVQLHLHPHWMFSERKNGQWQYPPELFRLHEFDKKHKGTMEEWTSSKFISEGKQYLENLLKPLNRDYSCVAFRAGGWCLQPEHELMKSLVENGVFVDSTIYNGGYEATNTHYFDFRETPFELNWWIDPEAGLHKKAKPGKDRVFEVCIGSYQQYRNLWLKKIKFKLQKRRQSNDPPKGLAAVNTVGPKKGFFSKIQSFLFSPLTLTFDGTTAEEMYCVVSNYLNHFDCQQQDYYLSMIGHPKNLGASNLIELEKFIKIIKAQKERVAFTTLLDVSNRVKEQITIS